MILNILFIVIGFALLIKGADFLVEGARGVAKKFNIPEIIIGLTVVSIGTSMPELFVNITSSLNGYDEMVLGNIIGSNLCNLLLILGLSATINHIKFRKETKYVDIPICLFITVLFTVLCNIGGEISFVDSLILLVLFVSFILYTIFMARSAAKHNDEELQDNQVKKRRTIVNLVYIVLGIIGLKIGGDLTVDNAEILAKSFNVSDKIISLTILAIGTSLPELVTSVMAAIKKDSDIAIGNVIGSNIANILLIIGASGVIAPVTYDYTYNIQLGILIVATFVLGLFPYTDRKDEMTKSNGITYLMLYALYMVLLFVK